MKLNTVVDLYIPNDLTEADGKYVLDEINAQAEAGFISSENCVLVEKFDDGTFRFVKMEKAQVKELAEKYGCDPREIVKSVLIGKQKSVVVN
jgi:hypothetical protein